MGLAAGGPFRTFHWPDANTGRGLSDAYLPRRDRNCGIFVSYNLFLSIMVLNPSLSTAPKTAGGGVKRPSKLEMEKEISRVGFGRTG